MKFSLSSVNRPTPEKIRRFANAVLAGCGFITASAIISDYHTLAITTLIIGGCAKVLSDYFSEDNL